MRGFIDRDFIETDEGFFFCVIGSVHPSDRIISYIKYIPSKSGIWGTRNQKYSRILEKYTILNLKRTFNFLKQNFPYYTFYSIPYDTEMTAVPLKKINKHFLPEKKLNLLRQSSKLDDLQKKLIEFTNYLSNISNVPDKKIGVTGSLLLDIHNPNFSDIDLTVYGLSNCWKLRDSIIETRDNSFITRLKGKKLKAWAINKAKFYPLSPVEAEKIYERKWNLGFFKKTSVSIHPVVSEPSNKKYGLTVYHQYNQVKVNAVVSDHSKSIFNPGIYSIENVENLTDLHDIKISEAVTYETLYAGIAEKGEKIQIKGKLEKVIDKETKKEYYRILVGSLQGKGKEYIKIIE